MIMLYKKLSLGNGGQVDGVFFKSAESDLTWGEILKAFFTSILPETPLLAPPSDKEVLQVFPTDEEVRGAVGVLVRTGGDVAKLFIKFPIMTMISASMTLMARASAASTPELLEQEPRLITVMSALVDFMAQPGNFDSSDAMANCESLVAEFHRLCASIPPAALPGGNPADLLVQFLKTSVVEYNEAGINNVVHMYNEIAKTTELFTLATIDGHGLLTDGQDVLNNILAGFTSAFEVLTQAFVATTTTEAPATGGGWSTGDILKVVLPSVVGLAICAVMAAKCLKPKPVLALPQYRRTHPVDFGDRETDVDGGKSPSRAPQMAETATSPLPFWRRGQGAGANNPVYDEFSSCSSSGDALLDVTPSDTPPTSRRGNFGGEDPRQNPRTPADWVAMSSADHAALQVDLRSPTQHRAGSTDVDTGLSPSAIGRGASPPFFPEGPPELSPTVEASLLTAQTNVVDSVYRDPAIPSDQRATLAARVQLGFDDLRDQLVNLPGVVPDN